MRAWSLISLVLFVPGSLARGADAASAEKLHGKPKAHSLTINVNVASAIIMENDLLVGHAGDRLDSSPGVHDYLLSAPGYISRLVHIYQAEAQHSVTRSVTLLPLADKKGQPDFDFTSAKVAAPTKSIEDLVSLCAVFNASGSHLSKQALPCRRRNVNDDLNVFGTAGLFDAKMLATSDKALTTPLKHLAQAADDAFYWSAEEAYGVSPGNMLAANVLGYSSLRRRNCTRINEITMEQSAAKLVNGGLLLLRGLCLELNGKADKAVVLYQAALKAAPPGSPDLFYHIARAAYQGDGKVALAALQSCTQTVPSSYLCAEALAQVQTMANQSAAAIQTLQTYHRLTAAALHTLLKRDHLDPAAVNAAYELRPFNLEFALAALAAGGHDDSILAQAQLISDARSLKAITASSESHLSKLAQIKAYKALSFAFPKDPSGWIRIANLMSVQGNCEEAIAAADHALALTSDGDRRAALVVNRADCLVRLERFQEAKTQLNAIITSGHETWQAHYNLGIVHERLGSTKDALNEYRLALQGEMPAQLRAQVQQRLDFAEDAAKQGH